MIDEASVAVEVAELQPGDRVLVMSALGHICFRAEVDEVAPKFDIAWIRAEGIGERKILAGVEHDIRRLSKTKLEHAGSGRDS